MSGVTAPAVRLEHVVVTLGGRTVLDGTSLSVPQGALTVLVGPSGCGKTTLLRLTAGLIGHRAGSVYRHFERTGIVFQDHRLLPWRTARGNVAVGALSRYSSARERRGLSERLLSECGLAAADFGKYLHELSGGMRARVAIARALAAEPALLLLDEPFSGLDVARRLAMQTLVRGLIDDRGMTAVFVTHDLAEAVRIADEVVVMAPGGGRIVHSCAMTAPANLRDPDFVHTEIARLHALPTVAAILQETVPEN